MIRNILLLIFAFYVNIGFAQTTLFSENFEGSIAGWSIYHNTTGSPNPASGNWIIQTSPYSYGGVTYTSNDASKFIMSNSDVPGPGSITRATMQTPEFSTIGYQSISLNFYHHFDFVDDFDSAVIEVSSNGTTWTQVVSYNSSQAISEGVPAGFVNRTINISSVAANKTAVSIRFRHRAEWAFVWAMDNITVTGTIPLPVKFSSFTGTSSHGKNYLNWSTATETNNKVFEVERSLDGLKYEVIGRVNSQALNGNSYSSLDYQFIDERPVGSKQLYRLKQVDLDGNFNYSSIVVLKTPARNFVISSMYPNPVKSELTLLIQSSKEERPRMVVHDISGRLVLERNMYLAVGNNSLKIPVQQLKAGTYFLILQYSDGTQRSEKFIKQ